MGIKAEFRQRKRERTQTFIRSVGGVLLGSWAKARSVSSNQQSGVLVSPMGIFSKECIRGWPWEAGETVEHKGDWRSQVRNLYLLETSAAIQGVHFHDGLVSV